MARPASSKRCCRTSYLAVWRQAGTFRGEARVSTWIFQIAHYLALEARRQRDRASRERTPLEDDADDETPGVEYVAGTPAAGEGARSAAHLATCATCQREAAFWGAPRAALDDRDGALLPDADAEAGWQALRARLGTAGAPGAVTVARRAREAGMTPTMPATAGERARLRTTSGGRPPTWPSRLPRVVAAALLLALLGAGVYAATRGQSQPGQARIDQIKLSYASTGQLAVPEPFTTPDGLSIQLVAIERQPSRWLFAFVVTNQTDHAVDLLRAGADHRFMLVGAKPAGTPANEGEIMLVRPAASDLVAHPALPATVPVHALLQGWPSADTGALGYPPQLLLYRYATVHTMRCASPLARWTCQPADLYSAVEWEL
ncbi:MAG TPA: hypothetical protein VID73_09495 [Ktedonobacterales bacterium]